MPVESRMSCKGTVLVGELVISSQREGAECTVYEISSFSSSSSNNRRTMSANVETLSSCALVLNRTLTSADPWLGCHVRSRPVCFLK